MITIKVPTEHILRDGALYHSAIELTIVDSNILKETNGGYTTYRNIDVGYDIKVSDVVGIDALGGEVTGLPMFIEITMERYNNYVPDYVPNSSYVDEGGNEIRRKWSEWRDDNHIHITTDNNIIIVQGNSFGEELHSSVIARLVYDGYNSIYNLYEMRAKQESTI
jgi:hypothetical protein